MRKYIFTLGIAENVLSGIEVVTGIFMEKTCYEFQLINPRLWACHSWCYDGTNVRDPIDKKLNFLVIIFDQI